MAFSLVIPSGDENVGTKPPINDIAAYTHNFFSVIRINRLMQWKYKRFSESVEAPVQYRSRKRKKKKNSCNGCHFN
jgi:hypothetical protein